jgi:membrane-bound lytic murein transglycosylase F
MLKKTVLTFAFLSILTTFYGFNAQTGTPVTDPSPVLEPAQKSVGTNALAKERLCVISPFDNLMRDISEKEGNDWRLMAAIAYHESRFTPDITSSRGACGLMQIMPSVAEQFDVPESLIADPATNVWLANKLLSKIGESLRFPAGTSDEDRMSIILACYNGGIGHVNDARRLARVHGEDPNSWEVVARYLTLKSEPEYYENEVVKCGRFTGSRQTLAYVKDVIGRYDKYCRIAVR